MSRSRRLFVTFALFAAVLLAPTAAHAYPPDGNNGALFPEGGTYSGCKRCHSTREMFVKGPHAGYSATTAVCKTCHWTAHDAYGPNLLFQSRTTLVCRACHDGTGSHGVYQLSGGGVTPAGSHRIEGTSAVPGGSASTGGSVTTTFSGAGNRLGCEDCHSPHGSRTVTPYVWTGPGLHDYGKPHDNLLRSRPTGADTTVTAYGSDWCMACHKGRGSGGTLHNHPVDSLLARPDPFTHDSVVKGGPLGPSPLAVSPDGASVYVADVGNRRVSQFTTAGVHVRQWTVSTNGLLSGMAFGADKNADGQRELMTSDMLTDRETPPKYNDGVRWWSQTGTLVTQSFYTVAPVQGLADNRSGTQPTALTGKLIEPMGTLEDQYYDATLGDAVGGTVSGGGRLFVVDRLWNRVAVFNRNVAPVTFMFAFPAAAPASAGTTDGYFKTPMAIAVSADDKIYVADTGNDRVQYFDVNGNFLGKWGSTGDGPGQFRSPTGIAVDNAGYVYVADRNQRVQRFSSAGVFQSQFGSLGDGPGELCLQYAGKGPLDDYDNENYLMADPRLTPQEGHGPICEQCHENSRDVGDLVNGAPAPTLWQPHPAPPMVPYFSFPHETSERRLLIETGDDLCLNCHAPGTLP